MTAGPPPPHESLIARIESGDDLTAMELLAVTMVRSRRGG